MNLLEVEPEKLRQVLGSSDEIGLSTEQARQNLKEFGPNTYSGRLKKRFGSFKRVFGDIMLVVFVVMSLYVIFVAPTAEMVAAVSLTLLGYLVFTVGGSVYAEHVLMKVRQYGDAKCRVKRDGKLRYVDSDQIVPGDTVYLERGEVIPCDGIIMRKRTLKVLEANVTGKCEAVIKREYRDVTDGSLPYFDCILFAGTVVLSGTATVLVCNTGKNIFDAKNANVRRTQGEMPGVHTKAVFVSKQLSLLWIPASFLIFAIGVISGQPLFEMFYYSLALMMAALPDGVRLLSELCVAMQVSSLMKKGCVLRNYAAVDKISDVSCISVHSDNFVLGQHPVVGTYLVDNCPYQFKNQPQYAKELLEYALVCNSSEKNPLILSGRNIDAALENACKGFGFKLKRSRKNMGLFARRDHDARMGFSSVFCMKNDRCLYVIRGTPQSVIARCTHIKKDKDAVFLSESAKFRLLDAAARIAGNGETVLAVAALNTPNAIPGEDYTAGLNNMVFVGLIGLYTPVRTAAAEAVNQCVKSGMDVLLLTAENPEKSFGLAKGLSMIHPDDKPYALDEAGYRRMDKGLFLADLTKFKVFCGLDPGEERDIVRYRNENGDVTASLTNALSSSIAQSEADVSFAYKGAPAVCVRHNADVLLEKESFEGVLRTLKAVRAICINSFSMLRFVLYIQFVLVSLAVFSLLCFGYPVIRPSALIGFGLSVGVCSALAIVSEFPREIRLNQRKSNKKLELSELLLPLSGGLLSAVCTCLCYTLIRYYTSLEPLSYSGALITLFVSGLLFRYSLASPGFCFSARKEFDPWSVISMILSLAVLAFLVYLMPVLTHTIDAIPDFVTVFIALVLGVLPALITEFIKKILRR